MCLCGSLTLVQVGVEAPLLLRRGAPLLLAASLLLAAAKQGAYRDLHGVVDAIQHPSCPISARGKCGWARSGSAMIVVPLTTALVWALIWGLGRLTDRRGLPAGRISELCCVDMAVIISQLVDGGRCSRGWRRYRGFAVTSVFRHKNS